MADVAPIEDENDEEEKEEEHCCCMAAVATAGACCCWKGNTRDSETVTRGLERPPRPPNS